MSVSNNKPPGLVPNKAAYLTKDLNYVITRLNDKNTQEEDNNIMLFVSDRFHIAAMIMGKQWNGSYPPVKLQLHPRFTAG